ncbi:PREDICTED: cytoskeleton-associated protein 4 isoform X2 [Nanorana parkeri]|uniref:cytoskeleton-associated protein 4 isoform X2 n=1 Tax=Nanorana parkeri TaxID=125878 RepID=UPI0008541A47|nr:PREDICTED: cytoskeleton-associated protein 4 isoform X2 [Nanorana parkeri]
MASARHRNKANSSDSHPPAAAAAAAAGNDVAKKNHKPGKAASAPAGAGLLHRLLSFVLYALLIALAAGIGWLLYNLLEEVSLINSKLKHLSEQKGELAETVHGLQKQVNILEKTVGRVEFISKDIQEKQQGHDNSIKNSEKELDVVGIILKKLQKDLTNVIQNVKDQGDRDLVLFDKTMKEKFNELNKSINEDIVDLTDVQKSNQEEISNVKAALASFGDLNSITDELKRLKQLFSELQVSFKSKEESIEWLMNNAINIDTLTTNGNEIAELKSQHDLLKEDFEGHLATVVELKEKLSSDDKSSLKSELDRVLKDFEQLSSSVAEIENNYLSTNNDLLKEIETNKDGIELRLTPLESAIEALNSEKSTLKSLAPSFEDYNRRLHAVEEAFAGSKHLNSGISESPEATETLSLLKEAQEVLSQQVQGLRSVIADLPSATPDIEKLQVKVTSVLEGHKQQIEDLKYDYEQWKNNLGNSGSSDQVHEVGLKTSITKLESDLKRLREAVDSLVAYSVKIENHDKDLESVRESLEDLRESTDKLQVKFEQIQENV